MEMGNAPNCNNDSDIHPSCPLLTIHSMAPPTAGKDTSIDNLNDDAVGEVLSTLPSQASLAVASAVCKPWLKICRSPAFLGNFHHRHPGPGPLLGLLHFTDRLSDVRLSWDAGASSRADLTVTLRNMDKTVRELSRFRSYLDLQIVDHYGGWCLLKSRKYNHLFAFDLLTGQNKELRWPPKEIFDCHMIGFLIDGGNAVYLRQPSSTYFPGPAPSDYCYFFTTNTDEWQKVQLPWCSSLGLAEGGGHPSRHGEHHINWKKRSGEVVYSLCGDSTAGWLLVALDTGSMSYSIVSLPRRLQHYRMLHRVTIMEMDKPGSICLVLGIEEPRFTVQAWIQQRGEGNTATGNEEWKLYRKVDLQGLASKLDVQLNYVHVVAAVAGVVHLRLVVESKKNDMGISCSSYYFASLDLGSREFTNVHAEMNVGCNEKLYPFFLPWRAPFLTPAGDLAEAAGN